MRTSIPKPYVEQHPDDDTARGLLADVLYDLRCRSEGLAHQRVLVQRNPRDRRLLYVLAVRLIETGHEVEADSVLAQLLQTDPANLSCHLLWLTAAVPHCPTSSAAHSRAVKRFMERVEAFRLALDGQQGARWRTSASSLDGFPTPFSLSYWPGDLKQPLSQWGRAVTALVAHSDFPSPPPRMRIQLMLISPHLCGHSVWYVFLRCWLEFLDRRFFDLTAINLGIKNDDNTNWLRRQVQRYCSRDEDYAKFIRDRSPDAIFYPDSFTHDQTVYLASQRLAPLQVSTWGHPVTSGLPNSVCRLIAEDKLTEPAYVAPAGPIAPLDILYGHRASLARGNLYMAQRCGFTKKVLIGTLRAAGFASVAAMARPSAFELWAVASKSERTEEEIRQLATEHFPR